MALALDRTRIIPSLPYKLDKIMDFGLFVMMATQLGSEHLQGGIANCCTQSHSHIDSGKYVGRSIRKHPEAYYDTKPYPLHAYN